MAAKIVVLYPVGSKSHFYAVMPVIEELGQRGHNVTVFSPFKGITKNATNVHEIIMTSVAKELDTMDIDWFAMQKEGATQILTMMQTMIALSTLGCEDLLSNTEFRRIVEKRDVDLFIVDAFGNEFTYPIIDKLGVPFVIHGSSSAFPSTLNAMGAPADYASVPLMLAEYDEQMTFTQRLINTFSGEFMKYFRNFYIFTKLDAIVQREFPGVKSIVELEGDASLYITNTHPVTNWPRSLPPTILSIGALHARPTKQLPPALKTFADEAKDGFIVFTLGSFVSVSTMPKETVDTFIRVFSKLPQRVVWKWEADIPQGVPSNIMMVDWLPQQDLLGHPNARLFITHGGMLGTQETIYHGVPLLGLPFGNDQRANVAKAVRGGWGLKLDWDKIDDNNLYEALTYLINDPSVRKSAKKLSQLMQEEIMPGKDVAAYWIEYVIRHGGTKHLQLASKGMPFYQRHLLDVALLSFVIAIVFLSVSYKLSCALCRCCFKAKSDKIKTN
ncbi:UDP-glycosyltransferase UGT5-like isoform X2 [Daphnia pulex]|nr:UDP-glycosyltransferase UGT5-like isoform X2 [Daphnia pulex]